MAELPIEPFLTPAEPDDPEAVLALARMSERRPLEANEEVSREEVYILEQLTGIESADGDLIGTTVDRRHVVSRVVARRTLTDS